MFNWLKMKKKPNLRNNKEVINDIRKSLRDEHRQLTNLFKDLDGFFVQLQVYFDENEKRFNEKKTYKKLSDYLGSDDNQMKGGNENG